MASRSPQSRTPPALKVGAVLELGIARIDFLAGEGSETLHTELFAAEATHYGAVDYGAAQIGEIEMALLEVEAAAGEIADEATGEGIARTGGVEDGFQQVAGNHKMAAAVEQDGAVFAALDDEGLGPHG